MTILAALFSRAWGYLLLAGGVTLALTLAVLGIRKSGRDAERADQAHRSLEAEHERKKLDADVGRADDPALDARLRRWEGS